MDALIKLDFGDFAPNKLLLSSKYSFNFKELLNAQSPLLVNNLVLDFKTCSLYIYITYMFAKLKKKKKKNSSKPNGAIDFYESKINVVLSNLFV